MNVKDIGSIRVLHTRFIRLWNAAGQLEVLNGEMLTEGAGTHPLFQGVRRAKFASPNKPRVSNFDGKVSIRASGLTLEFGGASVSHSGRVISIQLGS